MGITTTFWFNGAGAHAEGEAAAREIVAWATPALEAAVKESITGWPGGPIVDTGAMLNSVKGVIEGDIGVVSVGVDYAIYVEFGTYKMAARPFFQAAVASFGGVFQAHVAGMGA
jgi:hypothetical protein